MRLRAFVTTLSLCAAAPALAQPADREYRQALGTNFIAIPFGVFSFDYERAAGTGGFAVGLGGLHSATGDEDDQVTWAQAKLKYYPGERTLKGLAVGITAGALQHRDERYSYDDRFFTPTTQNPAPPQPTRVRRSDTGATIGVVVDYNWLLGRRRNFLFGIGVGAKRILKDVADDDGFYGDGSYFDGQDRSPLRQVYPDGRFTVGFAF